MLKPKTTHLSKKTLQTPFYPTSAPLKVVVGQHKVALAGTGEQVPLQRLHALAVVPATRLSATATLPTARQQARAEIQFKVLLHSHLFSPTRCAFPGTEAASSSLVSAVLVALLALCVRGIFLPSSSETLYYRSGRLTLPASGIVPRRQQACRRRVRPL